MKVKELIQALQKARDKNAEVRITNTNGDFDDEVFSVDEDSETVRIVIQ